MQRGAKLTDFSEAMPESSFVLACASGNVALVKTFLSMLKDKISDNEAGAALYTASCKNRLDVVKFLLENKNLLK